MLRRSRKPAGALRDPEQIKAVAHTAEPRLDKDLVLARVRTVSKVTSKLQVTIPKLIAERFGIAPGDEVEWEPGPDAVRVIATKQRRPRADVTSRLQLFDAATKRQRAREAHLQPLATEAGRGWTREELYERGSSR